MNPNKLLSDLRDAILYEQSSDYPSWIENIKDKFYALDRHLVDGGKMPDDWNYLRVGAFVIPRGDESNIQ